MHYERKPLLLGLLLAALVLAASDATVLHVLRGPAADFDDTVRLGVHSLASPLLTLAMRALTWMGAPVTLIGLVLGLAALLWRWGLRQRAWLPPVALALAEALTEPAKYLVRRPRPEPWFGLHAPESWSFPSGHSLDSTVCYLACGAALLPLIGARSERVALMAICTAMPLLIGISRIYLGVHWPTDVLTGWVAGACAALGLIRAGQAVR